MDSRKIEQFVSAKWDEEIVPQLVEYIRIPNKSPMFDADWVKNGYMDAAVTLMETWARAQDIPGMQLEVVRLEGRTPLIWPSGGAGRGGGPRGPGRRPPRPGSGGGGGGPPPRR